MHRIGLVTIYTVPNFGSVLQAFATQTLLESPGLECKIIDYDRKNPWYFSHGNGKPKLKSIIAQALGLKAKHRKEKKLERFRRTFLHLTKRYRSLDELRAESWGSYDAFVVGSDQVWNTRFSYGDSVYLLSFVPEVKPKISIASSFALKELPCEYVEKFRHCLSGFKAISVREKYGKEIIQRQLKLPVDVQVLLDPTLMLSNEEWLYTIPRSKFKKTEKYILLYMLAYAFKPQPYIFEVAAYLQKLLGYKIYVLEGEISEGYKKTLDCKYVIDSSIPEFIDYFNNADLVLTSSFHGTAFALNFGRPLISIVPSDGDDRQTSLLNELGLSRLAVKVGTDIDEISYEYDFNEEQRRLDRLRVGSVDWVKNTFSELLNETN